MAGSASFSSFPDAGVAVVIGATGGIGSALVQEILDSRRFKSVRALSRSSTPSFDLLSEDSIADAANALSELEAPVRLIVDATGILHGENVKPEKRLSQLDGPQLAKIFAVNAIGPALLMKHFLPLLPREGKAAFVSLSAKVGSIGDNHLGGWYGYRASKAALNQLVRTAAIELKRTKPSAVCAALHPGTVVTKLSSPYTSMSRMVQMPEESAKKLMATIDGLSSDQSGGFYAYDGVQLPW